MAVVAPPLAVKAPFAIAARVARPARPVLGMKAFEARPGASSNVPSTENCSLDNNALTLSCESTLMLIKAVITE
jgi:hypothetical protein